MWYIEFGFSVLENSYPNADTTTTTSHDIWQGIETYKLLAGTVESNNDYLIIEACFVKNTTTPTMPNTRIRFNNTTTVAPSTSGLMFGGINKVRIITKLTRISNTAAKVETSIVDCIGNTVYQIQDGPIQDFTGLDFNGTDYDIECSAYSIATGDVTVQSFTITYYKI